MYNVKRLMAIALEGLEDMLPAVRLAFNDDPTDDRLNLVYGPSPRAGIAALAVFGVAVGVWFGRHGPGAQFNDFVHWPAVFVGMLHAVLIRRYLFGSKNAAAADFPWLAASLVPALALLVVVTAGSRLAGEVFGDAGGRHSFWPGIGSFLVAATDALGVAATLTIAVATLCFSRNWVHALWDLSLRVLVFRIMIWVTAFVLLEVGVIGPIVSVLLEAILGLRIPDWLPDLVDQLTYAGLLTVVYLAVIGATWTVCRRSFSELLETGHVHVLDTIVALGKEPGKDQRAARDSGGDRAK